MHTEIMDLSGFITEHSEDSGNQKDPSATRVKQPLDGQYYCAIIVKASPHGSIKHSTKLCNN
jgi:hypothetical protein